MFWQDWFSTASCNSGWTTFKEGFEQGGLAAGLAACSSGDRQWGAQNTYRVEMLIALAQDSDNDVRYGVASNAQTPAETRDRLNGVERLPEAMSAPDPSEDE